MNLHSQREVDTKVGVNPPTDAPNLLHRMYFRTAREWLLSRFILSGGYVDKPHSRVSRIEWGIHEINCHTEMRLILKEIRCSTTLRK